MITFPGCKINLGLHIVSKRSDGYHEIETCFYPVPWTDMLEIVTAPVFRFTTTGISLPGSPQDNLCVKAYELLKAEHALGNVDVHLHKILPFGAGLGGGSSNAASMLLLMNSFFSLGLSADQLKAYAARLGSDCAFFIDNLPAIGSGRGEVLTKAPVSLKGKFLVVIVPSVHVSTAEAYSMITPRTPAMPVKAALNQNISSWKEWLFNDFEEPVFKKHPELKEIKKTLYQYGAQYAGMSGSGSSLFGLFDKPLDLLGKFPACTYWASLLN